MAKKVLQEITKPLLFLSALFVIALWLGYLSAQMHPVDSLQLFQKMAKGMNSLRGINPFVVFLMLFTSTWVKTFLAIILGTFFWVAPAIFVFISGALIGVMSSVAIANHGAGYLIPIISPHGILELPAFFLASAYGIRLGTRYWYKLRYNEPFRPAFVRIMKNMVKYVLPLVIFASVIETVIISWFLKTLA